jgi:hypothetical protein
MKKILILVPIMLMIGCAQQSGWQPTIDTYQEPVYVPPQQNYQQQQTYQQPQQNYQRPQNQPPRGYYPPPPQGYYQPSQPNVNQSMAECKALAERSAGGSGVGNTATDALGGAAIGAAGGAIIGAFTGSAGTGAALGAAVGGLGGGSYGAISSNNNYKQAYSNCMRGRGFRVVQ